MNDETVKAHSELATRNSREAVRKAEATDAALTTRMAHLEAVVSQLAGTVGGLEQKYNLLLSKRFNGKGTSV